MKPSLVESPKVRMERYGCIAALTVAFFTGDWLLLPIMRAPDTNHTPEFVALGLLLFLVGYLVWLLWTLLTVRYTLTGTQLVLRQAMRELHIARQQVLHVHRWRRGWGWDGGARGDLGVEHIALFPPIWLAGSPSIWVIVYEGEKGERKAVAFRPSGELLSSAKTWAVKGEQEAG